MDEKLIEKAKSLGIDHEGFKDEDSLKKAIEEKDKKTEDIDNIEDIDTLKKELKKFRDEAKKAFESRDEAKKERKRIQAEKDAIESKLKDNPSKEEYESLRKELDEVKKAKEEYDKKIEEEENKNKSEAEKIKIRFEKELEKLKKDMDEAVGKTRKSVEEKEAEVKQRDVEIENLRKHRLRSEIIEHASKMKAFNPTQIARLLMSEFEYDRDVDRFFFYKKDSKGKIQNELEVEERVKEFLSDPENENLVEVAVKSGTGHRDTDDKKLKNDKTTLSDDEKKKYDPNDPIIKTAAARKGLSVEDHIKILIARDEKLAKIRGTGKK
jgi:chromosome segregation ATPase